ncbi:hypothetical protein ASC74_29375 [Pseudomonas sp. Root329]|uniref:hypothetical protein n=1 Tax=Pseudomonas sp. Root329 TaxID=1736515 RepID=UPI0006F75590|nr:hypothetical protein [Pseudomonas sp. Root329]KQV13445.1 hypothetical protein ASC74_29375 [Pseudomonas sp. Root329]
MNRLFLALGLLIASFSTMGADMSNGADNFYKSEKVIAEKVTFKIATSASVYRWLRGSFS